MSRIYEAIRRASFDGNRQREQGSNINAQLTGDPGFAEGIEAIADAVPGGGAKHRWTPTGGATPCMDKRGAVVEQFRSLRSSLSDARHEQALKTLLISSGMPSEGKSFVATNLALSLVRRSLNRVLLVDCDLRRPSLHKFFGAPNTPGLSEYLAGEKEAADIFQQYEPHGAAAPHVEEALVNLTLIPAGKCSDHSAELINNGRLQKLIALVSQSFDWILIDSPPALVVTDAMEAARCADAVLLVARQGFTPYPVLQRAQAAFRNSRILGVVLNAAKDASVTQYYGYYAGSDTSSSEPLKQSRSTQ